MGAWHGGVRCGCGPGWEYYCVSGRWVWGRVKVWIEQRVRVSVVGVVDVRVSVVYVWV